MEDMISMTDVIFASFVVGALVEIFKTFKVKKKWLQVVSVIIGVIFGLVYMTPEPLLSFSSIKYGLLSGLISGLMASGLYEMQKARSNKNKNEL